MLLPWFAETGLLLLVSLVSFLDSMFNFGQTNVISAANLTTWGFQDTMRDPHNGGCGGNRM
jgi:hypothetical protein